LVQIQTFAVRIRETFMSGFMNKNVDNSKYIISQPSIDPIRNLMTRLIFPVPKPSYTWNSCHGELLCIVGAKGNIVPCLLISSCKEDSNGENKEIPRAALIIYCHANAEDIGSIHDEGLWFARNLGVHVLIPE
jgi:hypothetical protein